MCEVQCKAMIGLEKPGFIINIMCEVQCKAMIGLERPRFLVNIICVRFSSKP